METISMGKIAALTGVRRPVVSVWRSRYATGAHPFPQPTHDEPLLFATEEIARWLEQTGLGNNPEAVEEIALHSTAFERANQYLDESSALLLLHQLGGEPVTDMGIEVAMDLMASSELPHFLTDSALPTGSALAPDIDRVAEAAFSAVRVLDQLVENLTNPDGPWRTEALTTAGERILGTVLAELHRAHPRKIVPLGAGGLLLTRALTERLAESDRPALGAVPSMISTPELRTGWRRLAAHGFPIVSCSEGECGPELPDGALALLQHQDASSAGAFFAEVDRVLIALGPNDALVVVGPASFMTDDGHASERRRLLVAPHGDAVPLRYVARLPKGLSRFGGRRRLALWVFSPATSGRGWTVIGSHSDTATDEAACVTIAADVSASIHVADVNAHAFRDSAVRATDMLLRRDSLQIPPDPVGAFDGHAQHARILERDRGLLDGIAWTATTARPATISMRDATGELASDTRGTRLPREYIGGPLPGSVGVIGADEIRDPSRRGQRAIDRIVLEQAAARARLTEPGDVVYVASGGPAAFVDHEGGHVVESPARIFRCRDAEDEDRQLVPEVVAADIAAQPGHDRETWRLRTVAVDRVRAIDETTRRIRRRRADLLEELHALDALETELLDGLSAGSLAAEIDAADAAEEV